VVWYRWETMKRTDAKSRQVLFVHGAGHGSHDEWDDKLVKSLQSELGTSYEIRFPRIKRMRRGSDARIGA
jgi:hypothetical protein